MDFRYLSINQLSELTGKDRRTIKNKLVGLKPYREDGRAQFFDVHLALPFLYDSATSNIEKKILEAQLEHEQEKVRKIKMENARREGELIEVSQVGSVVSKEYTAVRAGFLSLGSKLALSLEGRTPAQIKEMIDESINKVLSELSADQQYNTDQTTSQDNTNNI